jgi:hypothetical protein
VTCLASARQGCSVIVSTLEEAGAIGWVLEGESGRSPEVRERLFGKSVGEIAGTAAVKGACGRDGRFACQILPSDPAAGDRGEDETEAPGP